MKTDHITRADAAIKKYDDNIHYADAPFPESSLMLAFASLMSGENPLTREKAREYLIDLAQKPGFTPQAHDPELGCA